MKKSVKILVGLAMAASVGCSAVAFSACGNSTSVEGEYHYANPWGGADYGIKVNVDVQGDKIKKVTIVDSDYVEVTDSWENKATWTDNVQTVLSAYRGEEVLDVLSATVTTQSTTEGSTSTYFSSVKGQPTAVSDSDLLVTGATQCSGRLLLAVQDALKKLDTYTVAEGAYHYANPWGGADYGVNVRVILEGQTIKKVVIVPGDYTVVTSSWANKSIWENGVSGLLESYEGKTVAEVNAVTVTTDAETVGSADTYFSSTKGQPTAVSDSNYVITGSTQGSGRLLLAVQNALSTVK
jgi:hypothetical protein